ncbi:lactosylceramide 4-alpha-galactosyltransferase-like isoform X2 [Heptranchias perlo]
MKNNHKGLLLALSVGVCVIFYLLLNSSLDKVFTLLQGGFSNLSNELPNYPGRPTQGDHGSLADISSRGDGLKDPHPSTRPGIMFVQTSSELEPSQLAVCAVESAARANPKKAVYFFMKEFNGSLVYQQPQYKAIPLLSSFKNIVILPLDLKELFSNTRLAEWYEKVNPSTEKYWIHVLSDACRIALLWKYGGIYLDTDIISLKTLEFKNFICSQSENYANSAALGFNRSHSFTHSCITDYVENYNGDNWGQQGPDLISRMFRKWCNTVNLDDYLDAECNGIHYLPQKWFYPVPYSDWKLYFVENTWKENDASGIEREFSQTRGVHIWNFLSGGHGNQIKESRSLMEYFFSKYCPSTYKILQDN